METILLLENLSVRFATRDGWVNAVTNVDLSVEKGKVTGLIGETGCGKTVLGKSALRLLPSNSHITGNIFFEGRNIARMGKNDIRQIRGRRIAYICQNPQEALNPVLKNGSQIMESVRINRGYNKAGRHATALRLLASLQFADPKACMESYPGSLSGGMKQRVLAAMGMSGSPALLIADEPTKGLDALIRGQVIATIKKFIESTGSAALIITHDLKFASALCDTIAVMYAGEIVESGSAIELFSSPEHPYLQGLIDSLPEKGLQAMKGAVCSPISLPEGCRFSERCPVAKDGCVAKHPKTVAVNDTHFVRCHRFEGEAAAV